MATETVVNRPAPFVEDIGKQLSQQALGLQKIPVITTGIAGITRQAGETDAGFKARQDAARAFTTRQQNLAGIAPTVAGQDALQQQAQALAQSGIGSFQPFVTAAQQAATDFGTGIAQAQQLTGTGAGTGAGSISSFMSPYQQQVIDTTLAEFDRQKQIEEQNIRSRQAQLGALDAGRSGVQLAEFGAGAGRDRAALQAGLLQQGFADAANRRQQDLLNQRALAGDQLLGGEFQTGLASLVQGLQGRDVSALGTVGAIQQAQAQAELDAQREANRLAAFEPYERLGTFGSGIAQLISGYPGRQTFTSVPNPTPLQTALGVGSTLSGIYGNIMGPIRVKNI